MLPSPPQQLPDWLLDALHKQQTDFRGADQAQSEQQKKVAYGRFEALQSFIDKESFQDNIHGPLRFNRLEIRVINTPEFQRLRWISQLGFARDVFNTAEHSRFSHSLGACEVSKRMVDILNSNIARTAIRMKEFEGEEQRTFSDLLALHTCLPQAEKTCCETAGRLPFGFQAITWTERVVIGLATLLHDISHCPFSHDIEGGYPELPRHDAYAKNPALRLYLFDTAHSVLARVLEHFSPQFLVLAQSDPRWQSDPRFAIAPDSPEAKRLLAELVFELHAFETQRDIEQGSVPVHPLRWPEGIVPHAPEKWPDDTTQARWKCSRWLQLYRRDLVENTICADLIDYLGRDSRNSGLEHAMDFKFLEQMTLGPFHEEGAATYWGWGGRRMLRIVFDVRDVKRGTPRHEVINEIFNYLQQRYFLRARVCYHRATQAGAAMLKRAVSIVFREEQTRRADKRLTLEMLHLDFRCNSDDALLRYLAGNCGVVSTLSPTEQWGRPFLDGGGSITADIGRRLLERRLYRPLVILAGHRLQIQTNAQDSFRNKSDTKRIVNELYTVVMQDIPDRGSQVMP